jgi:hypothetical protein
MFRFSIILFAFLAFAACNNNASTEEKKDEHAGHDHKHGHEHGATEEKGDGIHYGLTKITADGAIICDEVIGKLTKKEGLQDISLKGGAKVKGMHSKVEGTIVEMCQMSGCWFTFETKDGKKMFVDMKEHKSTPKQWAGKTVIVEGDAYVQTISIEELRHRAKENGSSRDELSKIKEPETEYKFIADGAILKK